MRSHIFFPFVLALSTFNLFQVGALPGLGHDPLLHGRAAADNRTTPLLFAYPGQNVLPTTEQITAAHPNLPISNIQGDIFVGMQKPVETFIFFQIYDPLVFKLILKLTVLPLITPTSALLGPVLLQPLAYVNIAFSQSGMRALGVNDNLGDPDFTAGQFAQASSLGDDTSKWETAFKGTSIHGVLLIGSDTKLRVDTMITTLLVAFGLAIVEKTRVEGTARPSAFAGHEHFGFLDGISNPAVADFSTTVLPGQSVVPTGTILTGRTGDNVTRPSWALDGSFLVFRKLKQLVPEFNGYLAANALTHATDGTTVTTLTAAQGAELLGARMVGRWRSGAPVDLAPLADNPTLGADPQRNNNFDYSHPGSNITVDQSRCPFSAHIRKTRPRADFGNTLQENMAIRAGIPYGPEQSSAEISGGVTQQERGLAFVEYQSSITKGFITQQQVWANNAQFSFLKPTPPGLDPVIGQAGSAARVTGGLDPLQQTATQSIPKYIIPLGGEYFFAPSISAILNKFTS